MLSNVPPFISDKALESILARYGKLVGPIKMIPLGLKNPELKHHVFQTSGSDDIKCRF